MLVPRTSKKIGRVKLQKNMLSLSNGPEASYFARGNRLRTTPSRLDANGYFNVLTYLRLNKAKTNPSYEWTNEKESNNIVFSLKARTGTYINTGTLGGDLYLMKTSLKETKNTIWKSLETDVTYSYSIAYALHNRCSFYSSILLCIPHWNLRERVFAVS